MQAVQLAVRNIRDVYNELNKSQKLYFISAFCLLFHFGFQHLPEPANKTFFSLFVIFLVWAVAFDFLNIYKALWSTALGKGVLLLGYTLLVNMSLSIGAQYVNEAIGVEPYLYKHSIVYAAIMSVPILAALVLGAISFLVIVFGSIFLFFGMNLQHAKETGFLSDILPTSSERYFIRTTMVRIISIGAVSYASFSLFYGYNVQYDKFIVEQTKAYIYHFEALEKSRCKLKGNTKFLPLNGNELVTIKKLSGGDYKFTHELCEPKIKAHNKPLN